MEGITIIGIVAVVFSALLLALGLICWTIVALFRPKRGGNSPEESKIMQDLYDGLQRMERRVESLETILLEQEQGTRSKRN